MASGDKVNFDKGIAKAQAYLRKHPHITFDELMAGAKTPQGATVEALGRLKDRGMLKMESEGAITLSSMRGTADCGGLNIFYSVEER